MEPTVMDRWQQRTATALFLLMAAAARPALAQQAVIVVRHAEKVDDSRDAALSAAGEARANRLADILGDAGVTAIFATEFQRTRRTVEPLAARLRLPVVAVPASDTTGLVARIRTEQPRGIVVVSGHSNTVPEILRALGAVEAIAIGDAEYDNLFVVVPRGEGPPLLLRLRY
jgi:broad specificity phosphatase PhoE